MASNDPVILTLLLDKESFAFFEKLRRLHFPEERNFLQAHLTLFHYLPPEHYQQLLQDIAAICKQQQALQLQVREVKMMGRGVAYRIESDRLMQINASELTKEVATVAYGTGQAKAMASCNGAE